MCVCGQNLDRTNSSKLTYWKRTPVEIPFVLKEEGLSSCVSCVVGHRATTDADDDADDHADGDADADAHAGAGAIPPSRASPIHQDEPLSGVRSATSRQPPTNDQT